MADGFVTLQARLKRFAKVAGEMVSLEFVERVAAVAQPHSLHAASSYKDSRRGEVIVLFTQDKNLAPRHDAIRGTGNGSPGACHTAPRNLSGSIPLLGNGKKDYVTLAKMAPETCRRDRGLRVSSNVREQRAWYVYDFANSAFASTVITLFFGPYLTSLAKAAAGADGRVHPFGIPVEPRSWWGYMVAFP